MPIYTKTGDDGTTAVFGGKRVSKADAAIELAGTLDEANAHLGLVVSCLTGFGDRDFVGDLQSDLFSIGSMVSGAQVDISMLETHTQMLETAMDRMGSVLPELTNFILPGPTAEVAQIHIARTVVRKAERRMVSYLATTGKQNDFLQSHRKILLSFLNRLSDYLFVLGRTMTVKQGKSETIWKGKHLKGTL